MYTLQINESPSRWPLPALATCARGLLIAAAVVSAGAVRAVDTPIGTDQYTASFDPAMITHPDLSWPDTSSGRCTFVGAFGAVINPLEPLAGPPSRSGTFVVRFTPAPGRRFTTGSISHGGQLFVQPSSIVQGSLQYRLTPVGGGAAVTGAFPSISVCGNYYNLAWLPGQFVYGAPGCSGPAALSQIGPIALPQGGGGGGGGGGGFDCEIDLSVLVSGAGSIGIGAIAFQLATEPIPPCAADINGSGTLTVQDIFDFLAAYFSGDPAGDFNGAGGATVQDIFDFLAAYFAGCA